MKKNKKKSSRQKSFFFKDYLESENIFDSLADKSVKIIHDILVFPSMMEHRINPILSGERKVLVSWAWGTLFK